MKNLTPNHRRSCGSNKRRIICKSEESASSSSEEECNPGKNEVNSTRERQPARKKAKNVNYQEEHSGSESDETEESENHSSSFLSSSFSTSDDDESETQDTISSEESEDETNRTNKGKILKLRNNRWRIKQVPKDGNCLFSSMAILCQEEDDATSNSHHHHFKYRRLAVQAAINQCWSSVENDVNKLFTTNEMRHINSIEELQEAYKQKMMTVGIFGSDIEIRAAVEVLPINISYIQKYDDDNSYRVCNFGEDLKKPRKWLLLTGPLECGHFEPLIALGKIEEMRNGLYYDAEWKDEINDSSESKNDVENSFIENSLGDVRKGVLKTPTHQNNFGDKYTRLIQTQSEKKVDNQDPSYKPDSAYQTKPVICSEKYCVETFESAGFYLKHFYRDHNRPQHRNGSEGTTLHPCPVSGCEKIFKNHDAIYKHFRVKHFKMETIKCTYCVVRFATPSKLKRHEINVHKAPSQNYKIRSKSTTERGSPEINTPTSNNNVKTKEVFCNKGFDYAAMYNEILLNRHKTGAHTRDINRTKEIKACNKVEKLSKEAEIGSERDKADFQKIEQNTLTTKNVICSEKHCYEAFYSTAAYMHHLYRHHNKPWTCDEKETGTVRWPCPYLNCQTSGQNWHSIYSHFNRYHIPRKPSICKFCFKQFHHISKLKRHVKNVHQNESRLRPDYFKSFLETLKTRTPKVKMYLADVMSPPKENKQFPCWVEGCRLSFETAGGLSIHLTKTHREHKPYDCPLENCGGMFSAYSNLKLHVKQRHGRTMEGMKLLPPGSYDITEPPIPCSVTECRRRFWDTSTMERHLREFHSDRGYKPYKCEWIGCDKSYRNEYSLNSHVKKFHEGSNDEALSKHEEDSDSCRYYYNGITKEQIVSNEITRLIHYQRSLLKKKFTVYFVLGLPNDLLETGPPTQIFNGEWLADLQNAEEKLTTLSLYVGSCENADISTYHTDPEKYKYSSIGQYLAEEKGKCYKVAAINCKSKEEMLTTEATAQQFIEIRYRAQTGDPNFSGGMVYEPMWTHTSVQFSMKTSDDRYDTFFNTAKNKSHNVFCLDNDCQELKHNAMAYQCHVSLELPFIGLVHVHDIFKEVELRKE